MGKLKRFKAHTLLEVMVAWVIGVGAFLVLAYFISDSRFLYKTNKKMAAYWFAENYVNELQDFNFKLDSVIQDELILVLESKNINEHLKLVDYYVVLQGEFRLYENKRILKFNEKD